MDVIALVKRALAAEGDVAPAIASADPLAKPEPGPMLTDEQGNWSAGRVLALSWTALCALVILWALAEMTLAPARGAVLVASVPNAVWSFLGGVEMALITWAAGPRVAQYLAPQIGSVATALTQAKRDARLPSRSDDERGAEPAA